MKNNLNLLSTRSGFNASVRFFKTINSYINECSKYRNLADLINESINNDNLEKNQIKSIIKILLIDKFQYCTKSINLKSTYDGPLEDLSKIFKKWNIFDIVIVYYHPQLGTTVINPKKEESWKAISGELKNNELIIIYTGFFDKEYDKEKACRACDAIAEIIQGGKVKDSESFKDNSFKIPKYEPKKPEKKEQIAAAAQPQGVSTRKKLSGRVGIRVTNEVFHNGNVEAWKKIIESYEIKFPDTKVFVFYDNEQINNLNTLFTWGKVKSGTLIYISLYGPEFRHLAKLKNYLYQGASHNFEAFLKGMPGTILNLF